MLVTGKALGQRRPLFEDWSIPIPPDYDGDEGITLRELIERIVRQEVRAFRDRQQDRQFLRALTAAEIADGVSKGKIEMGGSQVGQQEVDEDQAVAAAWVAFEDGLYLVVIDDVEQKDLDRQVYLQPDSRITFIRLSLLSGA